MRSLVTLVAPLRCTWCGSLADAELCGQCADFVAVLDPPWCGRCGTPAPAPLDECPACADLEHVGRVRSVVSFAVPARGLVLQLKRRGRRGLASDIGGLLAALVDREDLAADVVTWVPAGRGGRRAGFDHMSLVARAVAVTLGRPARRLLHRAREGPRQADVPLERRWSNVDGRFAARSCGGRVLLVDDVLTTGATSEACAQALRAAGAEAVDVVTWARTLRRLPPRGP